MFIERLTQSDINELIKIFDITTYKNTQTTGTHITIKNDKIEIRSFDRSGSHFSYYDDQELSISDFYAHFWSMNRSKFDYNEITKMTYYTFMYNKFGEEYLQELKIYLQNEKQNKLKDISKKIDKENDKLIENLTK
ncbi:MAG: hypothetical protein E7359_00125 [Clostridiales bacterium]|nr:hypothetical protein [Clostridiales bacterium]